MIKDVHCLDETDCSVFLNGTESELDLNTTLEENMLDAPCCLLIRRKLDASKSKSYLEFIVLVLLEKTRVS